MNGLLISCAILMFLTGVLQGFNIVTITALISTCLFCARKVGYFCKMSTLLTLEITGQVLLLVFQLMIKNVDWLTLFIVILLRVIFLGIAFYDMKMIVYVSEERRRDS